MLIVANRISEGYPILFTGKNGNNVTDWYLTTWGPRCGVMEEDVMASSTELWVHSGDVVAVGGTIMVRTTEQR